MNDQPPRGRKHSSECSCREWVEQELARLRHELATELETRRLRVTGGSGPGITVEVGDHSAVLKLETPDGQVGAEIMASTDDDEGYAAFSLSSGGNVLAVLSVLQPVAGGEPVTRLVFDRPTTPGSWTVVDVDGVHDEE